MTLRHSTQIVVNSVLNRAGLELRGIHHPYTDYRDYIPFQETIDGAAEAEMPVGEYIDYRHNVPGATQAAIDHMTALGVFAGEVERICEIGPGSGRYLTKVMDIAQPAWVEIYETSPDWAGWLAQEYGVVVRPCDGMSLSATATASIDLVQAHKVLPGQPSLVICRYYLEMARVVRPGGKVVFDIVTEACLDPETLERWLVTGQGYQHYPCLMPKQYTIDFFAHLGLDFVGSFVSPMLPGKTECMVFGKTAQSGAGEAKW